MYTCTVVYLRLFCPRAAPERYRHDVTAELYVQYLYNVDLTNQKPRNLLHRQAGRRPTHPPTHTGTHAYGLYSEVALAKKFNKGRLRKIIAIDAPVANNGLVLIVKNIIQNSNLLIKTKLTLLLLNYVLLKSFA